MLDADHVMQLLKESGAIMDGHFRLTSGLHSAMYVEKFRLLERPPHTAVLCEEIARRFRDDGVSLVVGPAIGGIIIAYEVARMLGVRSIFLEREDGTLKLRRGFHIAPEDRVLVVEDIVTTGGSVKEVLSAVEATGAHIVGAALLVDRSGGEVKLPYRTEALLTLNVTTYTPELCPMCAEGLPIVKPGSRTS